MDFYVCTLHDLENRSSALKEHFCQVTFDELMSRGYTVCLGVTLNLKLPSTNICYVRFELFMLS